VDLVWAVLISAGVTAAMVASMLLVRRGAPEGSRFKDGDRASCVLACCRRDSRSSWGSSSSSRSRSTTTRGAAPKTEALVLVQQFETAQLMPPDVRAQFSGELICYGRAVIEQEWPAMASGSETALINRWAIALFRTLETVDPRASSEQSAFDAWLSQTSSREEARRDRVHAAEGIVPLPVWLVLFFSAALIFVYLLFFADSGGVGRRPGDDGRDRHGGGRRDALGARCIEPAVPTGHRRSPARRDAKVADDP
jgi:hypothetical protein